MASILKGEERIKNDDGTSLKVQYYDDKIVVHQKDENGNKNARRTVETDTALYLTEGKPFAGTGAVTGLSGGAAMGKEAGYGGRVQCRVTALIYLR